MVFIFLKYHVSYEKLHFLQGYLLLDLKSSKRRTETITYAPGVGGVEPLQQIQMLTLDMNFLIRTS